MNPKRVTYAFLFLFLSTMFWTSLYAQYDPKLLIPYCNKGKWGWSDTLGNIKIKPKFERADFFDKHFNDLYLSQIEFDSGKVSYIKLDGKLLFSKKYKAFPRSPWSETDYLILTKKNKLGVYSIKRHKLVLPVKYDEVIYDKFGKMDTIFFKQFNEITYKQYNGEETINTDFKKIEYFKDAIGEYFLFENLKGESGILSSNENRFFNEGELEEFKIQRENEIENSIPPPPPMFDDSEPAGVSDKETLKFRKLYKNSVYRFKILKIVNENGRKGVVNEYDEIILPSIYDEVKFSYSGDYAILKKDGKYGIKIFFTHYPTIEPQYDSIIKSRNIPVTNTWRFGIMEVKIGDFKGFVGENGVEYFKR